MNKTNYVELVLNGIVFVRETSVKRLSFKMKKLSMEFLLKQEGAVVKEIITNIQKPVGSVFEGNL